MKDAFAAGDPTLTDCRPGFSLFFEFIRKECDGAGQVGISTELLALR
jgi:hypothetical protein